MFFHFKQKKVHINGLDFRQIWAILTPFCPKTGKSEFSRKIGLHHLFAFMDPHHAKKQKNPMTQFWENPGTDGQTDRRTRADPWVTRVSARVTNKKCYALLWEAKRSVQNLVWFMRFPDASSLFPIMCIKKTLESGEAQFRALLSPLGSLIIHEISVRAGHQFFFDWYSKILWFVTYMIIFTLIGQILREIFTLFVLAQLINSIIPDFFVLHYFRKGSTWERMIWGIKVSH